MTNKLNSKENLIMHSLNKFYNNKNKFKKLLSIIYYKSDLSLRLIDWFVTNYAKKNNTNFFIISNKKKKLFIVHSEYKSQLKAYSKKQFDPFCRDDRIIFNNDNSNINLETTVGQLNFFRWIIQNNIISYIKKHKKKIEDDMKKNVKKNKKNKKNKISAVKIISKQNVKIVVKF